MCMTKTQDTSNVYLDYAGSTPIRPAVKQAMEPYWSDQFANPQSSHAHGREAHEVVKKARKQVASSLQVQKSEIIFTSGATEGNSLALAGRLQAARNKTTNPEALVSAIEHTSLTGCSQSEEYPCKLIPVQADGTVSLGTLDQKISKHTAVVSVGYVNNEIGTIQPLADIHKRVAEISDQKSSPPLHTDASQAGVFENIQPERLGVDMMTINGHKLYGPKGVGVLWVRSGTPMHSLFVNKKQRMVGDYQQLRPGTPPVPLIAGFAKALQWAQDNHQRNKRKAKRLQDKLIQRLQETFPQATINGSGQDRIANNVSVSFPDTDHDFLATKLDKRGVSVSAASACQPRGGKSQVLSRIPDGPDTAIRITLGIKTDWEALEVLMDALKDCR